MAREKKPITIWNIAALIVIVVGAALTLLAAHVWIVVWSGTGVQLPVGGRRTVELPAGETLVYYQSRTAVPTALVTLHVIGPTGERVDPSLPDDDQNFKLRGSDLSGRALWLLRLPTPGVYDIGCYNANYLSDADIPADDRIVLFKRPQTLTGANGVRTIIHVAGATLTLLLGAGLYTLHAMTIRRRAGAFRQNAWQV